MKLLCKVLALGIFLLTSCHEASTTNHSAHSAAKSKLPTQEKQSAGSIAPFLGKSPTVDSSAIDTLHVVNDKIIEQLLTTLDYKKHWPELRHSAKKFELTPGIDDPAITDSIITYTANHNLYVYIKSGAADAGASILRCQLITPPIHFPKPIFLGMSKAALARVLGKKLFSADVLLVTEQEGYQRFYFLFQGGLLREVNFESFYTG